MRGLPQKQTYETVLRDAMTADSLSPTGIYFGTRSGQLYGSTDEGKSWKKILDGLPSIVCIKSAAIGDSSDFRRPSPQQKAAAPSSRSTRTTRKTTTRRSKRSS
jgi:hypothetical protein